MSSGGAVVFRFDDEGVNADNVARANNTPHGIEKQELTESLSVAAKIDRQPTDNGRRYRIMGQPLRAFGRQVVLLETRCAQRVLAGDLSGLVGHRVKDLCDAPTGVLGGLTVGSRASTFAC